MSIEEKFNDFWSAYPKKVGKKAAFTAFKRINPNDELLDRMKKAIEWQKMTYSWQDPQFIPNPLTWLHQERWEDECTVKPMVQKKEKPRYGTFDPEEALRIGIERSYK